MASSTRTRTSPERERYPHVEILLVAGGRRRGVLRWENHPQGRGSGLDPWCYSWQSIEARGWPLTGEEEQRFVAGLEKTTSKIRTLPTPGRDDITALLISLRCGMQVGELARTLPGVDPAHLLAAHRHLDSLLTTVQGAWSELLSEPGVGTLLRHRRRAENLLPVPLQLLTGGGYGMAEIEELDDGEIEEWAETTRCEMAAVRAQAEEIEEALGHFSKPSAEAVELGRLLYDPRSPSLWSEPYFLPRRVGELVPVRVAALLGERQRRRR